MKPKRTGNGIRRSLKSAIAFLILTFTSLVEAQTIQTLCSFNFTTGANPYAGLTLGTDGDFYGTTEYGGSTGHGTVFKVTTNGTLTTLHSFAGGRDGAAPYAGLTLGTDGNSYGTTEDGSSIYGTVFKVTTNGTLTTLIDFGGSNGANPYAGLTLGLDGNFYGTTMGGGSGAQGTVFKVTTNGTLTTLHSFAGGKDGAAPYAGLTLGTDGNFYGTTEGGRSSYATVFKVTTNGMLTTLVYFNSTNGANPQAALTLGTDGNFYGTTENGGSGGYGTVFTVTTNATLTTLVSFYSVNGAYPYAGLTLGTDGNFYGTTLGGGSGAGTVFRLLVPPVITVQPQSQTNNAGATATFLVSVASPNPLSYRWQKNVTDLANGGNIFGATTSTLTITSISDGDAASYSVIVSNSNGSLTSSTATLTVIDPPSITTQPTNLLVLSGTNAAFGVSLTGTAPVRYQWRFNGTNLLNATNAIYTIPSVTTNKAGNYSVVVTNSAGSVTSSNAALTVVVSPKSQTNYASSTPTFTATAFSPESLSYQWKKNGTNLVEDGRISGTTNRTLTIASVLDADAASYSAIVSDASSSVTTSNAVLTVNDSLFIALQPQSQTVGLGSNVTFTVIVYGAPPFILQWYFNGTPVGSPATGTNVSSCTLTNVGTNQAGDYSVEIYNGYGSLISSNGVLTVKVYPPIIEIQPSSQRVMAGSSASFTVSVSGTAPFRYQWRFNGSDLFNATNSVYAIQAVATTNTGDYSVVVNNLASSVTSSNALLTVIVPPTIALQLLPGYPLLNLYGMLTSNFVVQYSTNLAGTNWVNLLSLTNLPSSPYLFLDTAGVVPPARYYRAIMQ